jgi:hypothetical protein
VVNAAMTSKSQRLSKGQRRYLPPIVQLFRSFPRENDGNENGSAAGTLMSITKLNRYRDSEHPATRRERC